MYTETYFCVNEWVGGFACTCCIMHTCCGVMAGINVCIINTKTQQHPVHTCSCSFPYISEAACALLCMHGSRACTINARTQHLCACMGVCMFARSAAISSKHCHPSNGMGRIAGQHSDVQLLSVHTCIITCIMQWGLCTLTQCMAWYMTCSHHCDLIPHGVMYLTYHA